MKMGAILYSTLQILVGKCSSVHYLLARVIFLLIQKLLLPSSTKLLQLDGFLFQTEHPKKPDRIFTQSKK